MLFPFPVSYCFAENATTLEKRDLLNELKIMVRVGDHPNVVSLVGACTRKGRYIQNATDTMFDTPYETQDPTSLRICRSNSSSQNEMNLHGKFSSFLALLCITKDVH